jgi:hypothetical protein
MPDAMVSTDAGETAAPDASSDAGLRPTTSQCAVATNGPTKHLATTLTADETWTAADSPHIIYPWIIVHAHVTIEPCAVVQLAAGASIQIDTPGVLEAGGEAGRAVTIEQMTAGARWDSIYVSHGGLMKLSWTSVSGGGSNNPDQANISLTGGSNTGTPDELLFVDHARVEHSRGYGISVHQGGGFAAGSRALTVTGSGEETVAKGFPITIPPTAMTRLPDGDYTGNAIDAINLDDTVVDVDTTAHPRNVPYVLGSNGNIGDLRVGPNGGSSVLTLEPHVEMHFGKDNVFAVNGPAALAVEGTLGDPVTLTSGDAAVHWAGVRFTSEVSSKSHIYFAHIDDAGGASLASGTCNELDPGKNSDDGAIGFYAQPPGAIVQNTTISNSAGFGITMDYDGEQVPMVDANTFVSVHGCFQSFPPDSKNTCPKDPPCPM